MAPERVPQRRAWLVAALDGDLHSDRRGAAHAMESGADLLTFDAHFEAIDGLVCIVPPSS
jgi:predicted nucleic acid-binding protein